jgi:hypothetical protein
MEFRPSSTLARFSVSGAFAREYNPRIPAVEELSHVRVYADPTQGQLLTCSRESPYLRETTASEVVSYAVLVGKSKPDI